MKLSFVDVWQFLLLLNVCRLTKIEKMCNVMGIDMAYDPDPTYELTADNVKKMLAIYMRFRWTLECSR